MPQQTSSADFTGCLRDDRLQPHELQPEITEKELEIADHLRSGKFEDLVSKANKVDAEQRLKNLGDPSQTGQRGFMCLTGRDGSFSKEQDFQRLKARQYAAQCEDLRETANVAKDDILLKDSTVKNDKNMNSAYASTLLVEKGEQHRNNPSATSCEMDELALLREKRKEQLRREQQMTQHWKSQGHGVLRDIASEREFFQQVKPHERSVVLLYSNSGVRNTAKIRDILASLAKKHLETQVFQLEEQKAHFMLQLLDVPDGGLPILFLLRHGEVICRISRGIICDDSLTERKLEKLLKTRDAFGEGTVSSDDEANNSDEQEDSDLENGKHRGKNRQRLAFQRF
ncbi:unnamed protein product [Amoebophrya sp. A120]|nr:unnamed protein product [Amoebophrya sp. A120]|eukprot:GSA120T00020429001.1